MAYGVDLLIPAPTALAAAGPLGETLTRWTVRAALALYALSLAQQLIARRREGARPRQTDAGRVAWTLGFALFLAHVAAAFHYFHGWSHADAYRETARQTAELTGVASGFGLYLNYLFTLAWSADAAWWWAAPESRRRRPRWVGISLHAFMLFMAFNGTVVFETGATRWAAAGACVLLGHLAWMRAAPDR